VGQDGIRPAGPQVANLPHDGFLPTLARRLHSPRHVDQKSVSLAKGAIAGLIGGRFASWVMNQFQAGVNKVSDRFKEQEDSDIDIFQHELEPEEKKPAGTIVHYAYGSALGAFYGWAERSDLARTASGTLFGAVLWSGSDEIGVPMFGLSKAPTEYPVSTHAWALAAHAVYGVTTERVRRSLRRGYLSS